jgi:hypothetical protein
MHIVDVFEYAADPDEVFEMMTDEEFIEAKCQAQHATSYSASVHVSTSGTTAVANRELPTQGFPEFLTSLVGRSIHVVETVQWAQASANGTRRATLTVTMGTAPIGITGTITLEPGGAGTVVRYEAHLKAKVPFIGGKIERAAKPTLLSAMNKERETAAWWLEGEEEEPG